MRDENRIQNSELKIQKPERAAIEPGHSWMEEIEERIRLKAGNQPVHAKPQAEEKSPKEESKEGKYGSGMSAEQVEKVMKEFKK